jgi:hypothetical protein
MYKLFDLLLNFSTKGVVGFTKGTLWGIIVFLLSIVIFELTVK